MPTSRAADVTVVVPAYGTRDGMLRRAITSVVRTRDVHVIVVDDASPGDDVKSTCDEFDRVRYLRRSANGGVAAAQNSGLDAVETKWVCFLHSDDEFVSDRVGIQLELAGRAEGAIVGGACAYDWGVTPDPLPGASAYDFLLHRFGVHVSPYVFPTELVQSMRFDAQLRSWEDWDLLFRLHQRDVQFVAIEQPTAVVHSDGVQRLTESPVNGVALLHLYEKHRIARRSSQVRSLWEFKIARNLESAGDRPAARRWALRSLRSEPWHPKRVRTLFEWTLRRGGV